MGDLEKRGRGRPKVHGVSDHELYKTWSNMISRCHDTNNRDFVRYGARGVVVCERWRNDPAAFFADVGPKPLGYTLDRFPDKNGNYEPGNVRWATWIEQARNRRNNVVFTYQGQSRTIKEWQEILGGDAERARRRLSEGWSDVKEALLTPHLDPKRVSPGKTRLQRFSDEEVVTLRMLHAKGATIRGLAKEARVDRNTMRDLLREVSYKHVRSAILEGF